MTPDAALQQANFALNARRPQEAERIAGELLKSNPRHAGALHVIGYALLMQGRFQDAITTLEPVARSQHDAEFDTQLAIALRGAGRHDDALARLKRATKRRPPYAAAFLELGMLLIARKRYEEAIDTLRGGLEIAPMLTEFSLQLGYVLLQVRDFAGAKATFARVLSISPALPDALFGQARSHQELGENEAAVGFFRRYLTTRPNHWDAWLSLGHCLLELGDLDAGYECFRTAARGDPARAGNAIASLVKSARGKFWLKPSAASQFLRGAKS
jgi:tetratricopeptide (TPR) repeat protein